MAALVDTEDVSLMCLSLLIISGVIILRASFSSKMQANSTT